jgi:cell division protein ZapA
MTERRHAVRVVIAGEEYSIRSGETAEHTRAVAQHVDQAIKRVLNGGTVVETHKAAILVALQMTSELFRAREAREGLDEQLRALGAEVRRWLPPAKRGDASPDAEQADHPEHAEPAEALEAAGDGPVAPET